MPDVLNVTQLPASFADEEVLEEFMSRPSQALIEDLAAVDGDIMVLGVGGKMGPTLARLAKRAAPHKTVTGVARFSEPDLPAKLNHWGIETIKADLLDRDALESLPKPKNVIYLAGRKFGSSGSEELTWAMNVYCPALVAEAFRASRIVALSTACVYPFVPTTSGGAKEDVPPDPPGEYAQSCVGRERMFQHFSRQFDTPGCLIRLSYAVDTRYGVLFDVADAVHRDEPVDVTMGHANVIWQGDANAQVLRALRHCEVPAWPLNISGPDVTSIRWLAEEFGRRFEKSPNITGNEAETVWLVNTDKAQALFGQPTILTEKMIDWVTDWVSQGHTNLGKPTHFEARDGVY
jgi:nucleoside-diphosphate-sugar epimerase